MTVLKLTKSVVDSIPLSTAGQSIFRDSELKGFGLRVGSTSKVYIAESKVNGKVVRISIGKHGVYTAEQARVRARELLLMMTTTRCQKSWRLLHLPESKRLLVRRTPRPRHSSDLINEHLATDCNWV